MTAFLFGFSAGEQTISAGPCTAGIQLGILDLNLLGTDNAVGTTSVFNVEVPLEFAGLTVHMQAIDIAACAPTDVLTHTFSEPVVAGPRANPTRGRLR
jgi:hypothetical protein